MSDSTSSSTSITVVVLQYAARCSISLDTAMSIIVSSADLPAAPNPFRCDFTRALLTVVASVHPGVRVLGTDPHTYSYFMLALYRLLRHLIPHTDTVAAAAHHTSNSAPLTTPASKELALAVIQARIHDLFIGELRQHVSLTCQRQLSNEQRDEAVFTQADFIQPLLSVDAAADSEDLSAWQRWLISSAEWQQLAGAVVEFVAAEIIDVVGGAMKERGWLVEDDSDDEDVYVLPVEKTTFMHNVVHGDGELAALWRALGMPADCPEERHISWTTLCNEQFEQRMRAAVAVSAPWMFDDQQVEQRVADWTRGRLPSGDALFFRRFHIRPKWHTGVDVSDFRFTERGFRLAADVDDDDDSDDAHRDPRYGFFPMKAVFDLVDAAGVSRSFVMECRVHTSIKATKQSWVHVEVSHAGRTVLGSERIECGQQSKSPYARTDFFFVDDDDLTPPDPFADYLCHGHLHGMSEQQWEEAMGGWLSVGYYSAEDEESELERTDDQQAARSKEDMFPARLADVVDRERYGRLQRTEIRRMAAISTRLCVLDEGVDVAVFPCFQPAQMRRKFELVAQGKLETSVAGLPAALPQDLQGIALAYNVPIVDIPV